MFTLIATTTFGIEAITAKELKKLGYDDLKIDNGKVTFEGDELDIAICNTWLRTADRILISLGEFKAETFEDLFQGTKAIKWASIIPSNGKIHVVGKSIKSKLHSVPDCQSIVKKAIVESMKSSYKVEWFPEDGPTYKVEIGLLKDIATLTIDTTGPGLHKRGYREFAGAAPLKETLAAALVLVSDWTAENTLVDPFCGSGTILIEACLIAQNIAPGLNRRFVCEDWPIMDSNNFEQVRSSARNSIKTSPLKFLGYDIDDRVLRVARQNAEKAGISKYIEFHRMDFNNFSSKKPYCYVITNPPYGERIGDEESIINLYKKLGELKQDMPSWKLYVLTSYNNFEKEFGKKADKNRKLYNGKIQCYYYQYL